MTLLITGANSLLARTLIATLPAEMTVRAVDTHFDAAIAAAECVEGDLCDPSFVDSILADTTAVLHLAPLYTRFPEETGSLDHATRGTYQLAKSAGEVDVQRIVLGSSLDLFEPLWDRYRVDEAWRPHPRPAIDPLCVYLAEVAVREVIRVSGTPALCLRLGEVVNDEMAASCSFDPRWLHVEDAVAAIQQALAVETTGWRIFHIAAKGDRTRVPVARAQDDPLHYAPQHDFQERWPETQTASGPTPPQPPAARPIRKVVVFGAGGPLASATAEELAPLYTLRLTDVKPIEELVDSEPQSPGAPLPTPPQPPHEWQVVDVRDPAQVMAACAGMDAIVNCSVVRNDPADAFRVNTVGAYNIMRAAQAHGIKRVVHTGPFMLGDRGARGYDWDDWVVDDVPPRPGTGWVYIPSKLLGQEICRIYAEYYGLEVPALAFCAFLNPAVKRGRYIHPLSVSWQDAARAIRSALEVPSLPSPWVYCHIGTDLPHGVFPNAKAKQLLGWQPQDTFSDYYRR